MAKTMKNFQSRYLAMYSQGTLLYEVDHIINLEWGLILTYRVSFKGSELAHLEDGQVKAERALSQHLDGEPLENVKVVPMGFGSCKPEYYKEVKEYLGLARMNFDMLRFTTGGGDAKK